MMVEGILVVRLHPAAEGHEVKVPEVDKTCMTDNAFAATRGVRP
jgi:hypothetical protein